MCEENMWRKRYAKTLQKSFEVGNENEDLRDENYQLLEDNKTLLEKNKRLLEENTLMWSSLGQLRLHINSIIKDAAKFTLDREEKEKG